MVIFVLIFNVLFLAYGIITIKSKGIQFFYRTFHFYDSEYFIKAKFISHVINFIYSLMLCYFLYFKFIADAWVSTIPILYFLAIYIFVKLHERKKQK